MTESEYNAAMRELGIVMLDVKIENFKTVADVAKAYICLSKINERILLNENKELKGYKDLIDSFKAEGFGSVMEIKDWLKKRNETLENRGNFIDWLQDTHPDVVREYLERE